MSKPSKPDVYSVVNERILSLLDRGTVPWRAPFENYGAIGGAPLSVQTGKPYRGFNWLQLSVAAAERGFSSPYWITFNQAKAHDAKVRKGAKSEPVIFWKLWTATDDDGKPITDDKGREKRGVLARYYRVFNVEEVDGLPEKFFPKAPAPKGEFQAIQDAQRILDAMPNAPELRIGGDIAFYNPGADFVNMPDPAKFRTPAEYYSTAFHEYTHATGHASRLGRLKVGARFGSHDYSCEELVAEFGAAFLCGVSGISAPVVENQAAYIDSWRKRLRQDDAKRWIVEAAGKAQRAADYIQGIRFAADADDETESLAA